MNILKQTWAQLRSQRMLTVLGITGTALSIFLIMVVVMIHQIKILPFAPESYRGRMLHVKYALTESENGSASGGMSYTLAKSLTENLPSAEAATIYQNDCSSEIAKVPGIGKTKLDFRAVDDKFWQVFDFRFLQGKPFDKADFDAGLPKAVITRMAALRLFGTEQAVGREFRHGRHNYRVVGVVKDVSTLADCAYSEVWIPATCSRLIKEEWSSNGMMGYFSLTILARDAKDFEAIRNEYNDNVRRHNDKIKATTWKYNPLGSPYDQEAYAVSEWSNVAPDVDKATRDRLVVYLILLIVPAINLSGMTESRLRRRVAEIGVRRAYGSTRGGVFGQLIGESLIITLAAGVIGWLASIVFAMSFSSDIFSDGESWSAVSSNPPEVSLDMLVQWPVFFTVLGFCFILNLLSNSLPAWRASRNSIVRSLAGE